MRRFQLPSLTFKDSSDYDELLSPLETEAKHQLMDEKNSQLRNYFADGIGVHGSRVERNEQKLPTNVSHEVSASSSNGFKMSSDADTKLYEDPFEPHSNRIRKFMPESQSFNYKKPTPKIETSKDIPPPIPPHRPLPRQKLVEIEKYRMCKEILELERRSREMYDILMSPSQKK
uniref:Uncharacterized protein n=1 Tax=Panagrolaimus davidi TaxID=227884 RepID=A0A914PWC0_9BILA